MNSYIEAEELFPVIKTCRYLIALDELRAKYSNAPEFQRNQDTRRTQYLEELDTEITRGVMAIYYLGEGRNRSYPLCLKATYTVKEDDLVSAFDGFGDLAKHLQLGLECMREDIKSMACYEGEIDWFFDEDDSA